MLNRPARAVARRRAILAALVAAGAGVATTAAQAQTITPPETVTLAQPQQVETLVQPAIPTVTYTLPRQTSQLRGVAITLSGLVPAGPQLFRLPGTVAARLQGREWKAAWHEAGQGMKSDRNAFSDAHPQLAATMRVGVLGAGLATGGALTDLQAAAGWQHNTNDIAKMFGAQPMKIVTPAPAKAPVLAAN